MASSLIPTTGFSGAPPVGPSVTVNGETVDLTGMPAWTTALDLVRSVGLTGAKEGCAEGECGACSVLVARPAVGEDGVDDGTQWTAINACLIPAASLDGQEVVTAEGLGTPAALHPVQREMAMRGGSQCGYCTPGFVCSMAAEYYRPSRVSAPSQQYQASPGRVSAPSQQSRNSSGPSDAALTRPEGAAGRVSAPYQASPGRVSGPSQESRNSSGLSDEALTRPEGATGRVSAPSQQSRHSSGLSDEALTRPEGAGGRVSAPSQASRHSSGPSDEALTRPEGAAGRVSAPSQASHQPSGQGHEHGPNGFDLHALSGNLCRCTGYRPIRDAAYALGQPEESDPFAARRDLPAPAAVATRLTTSTGAYSRAGDLADLFDLMAEHPDAVLVAGSTDWGVEVNIRGIRAPQVIGIDRVEELRDLAVGPDAVEIGAALTLSEVEARLAGRIPLLDEVFPQFASRLIRNGATIGGNLGTGSPIGDTPPALLALEAGVVLTSPRGDREVPLSDYFTGYRQTLRAPDEVIRAVRIPLPLSPIASFHKIAKRRFDDISSVAVGFALDVADGVVRKARIGLGGVAATPVRAFATEAALEGRSWSMDVVREAAAVMRREGTPLDDHRASAAYRSTMLGTALLKLHARTASQQEVGA